MAGVPADGCPNLTGKNVRLLKHGDLTEMSPEQNLFSLYYTPGLLSVHIFNHVVDVTKKGSFTKTKAVNHRTFVHFSRSTRLE